MRRILLAILDRILVAALAAGIVLAVLLTVQPWQRDIDSHAAEPLDTNMLVTVRTELPDGTEALPPYTLHLWEYVWRVDEDNRSREAAFRSAFERDLHAGDLTFHLTHEVIDDKTWGVE